MSIHGPGPIPSVATARVIPFDHVFPKFDLSKAVGGSLRNTLAISVEGRFVATSIGYATLPSLRTPETAGPAIRYDEFGGPLSRSQPWADVSLADVIRWVSSAVGEGGAVGPGTQAVLGRGLRLSRAGLQALSLGGLAGAIDDPTIASLFEFDAIASHDVPFFYRLRDEGSGRELQNLPVLSTAGLGTSDGDRPFRAFARPIVFAPRSVVSLEVQLTAPAQGELHVCLHGFKVLGDGPIPDVSTAASIGRMS